MAISVYDLHLRCQALGRTCPGRRRSEARRVAVAAQAAHERITRLRDIIGELRAYRRRWR